LAVSREDIVAELVDTSNHVISEGSQKEGNASRVRIRYEEASNLIEGADVFVAELGLGRHWLVASEEFKSSLACHVGKPSNASAGEPPGQARTTIACRLAAS